MGFAIGGKPRKPIKPKLNMLTFKTKGLSMLATGEMMMNMLKYI